MKMKLSVSSPSEHGGDGNRDVTTFVVKLHRVTTPDEFMLPLEFYEKNVGHVPALPHYELEIIEPSKSVFGHNAMPYAQRSPTGDGLFISVPNRIDTSTRAEAVFEMWCLWIRLLDIDPHADLDEILVEECQGDEVVFINLMRQRGIYAYRPVERIE